MPVAGGYNSARAARFSFRSCKAFGLVHRPSVPRQGSNIGVFFSKYEAVYGYEQLPFLADTKYNMALLHKKSGERHLAKELYLECVAIYATVYGTDHRETIDAKQEAIDCA